MEKITDFWRERGREGETHLRINHIQTRIALCENRGKRQRGVAKTTWRDVSYQITKINLYKDGRHGKAWGIRHKAGVQAADAPIRISGVNKRGWKYIKASLQDIPGAEPPAVTAA
ncbi:hypothetical protein TRIUR3_17763 [Triticum urartu]|uniref:Uncharacterized protein n=1 Tax=Triticum urartu TaxID=4572 RepID=M7YZG0_TRIUA|nr:hypothetical protein TRIUR3_17763 [Triticum urartu]